MKVKVNVVFFLLFLVSINAAQIFKSEAENTDFQLLNVKTDSSASGGKYLEILDSGFVRWLASLSTDLQEPVKNLLRGIFI